MRRSVRAGDWIGPHDRGPEVEALQRALSKAGVYEGKISGVFDHATGRAVRTFQRARRLVVDGLVGPQTLGALRKNNVLVDDHFSPPAHRGQSGRDILKAERRLAALGYRTGRVDGVFDGSTARALHGFRRDDPDLPDDKKQLTRQVWDNLQQAYQSQVVRSGRGQGPGDEGSAVKQTERQLTRLGLDAGKVDGRFTAATAAAVATFQRKHDLEVTGRADQATRRAIDQAVRERVPKWKEQLRRFDRKAPAHNYARTRSRGVQLNVRTERMLDRAEYIMRRKYGHKGFAFSLSQGSYNAGGVAASAGTHDGGGAVDVRTSMYSRKTVDHMVKALRQAGFAAWSRGRGHDSFDPHIHALAIGDRQLSAAARSQVAEYARGGDGLVGSAADPDRHLGRHIPRWAKKFL